MLPPSMANQKHFLREQVGLLFTEGIYKWKEEMNVNPLVLRRTDP